VKVCIAEKPSVAREIAQVLGARQKKDGYYEGNGYQVTWTFGHFCQLREPEDYRPEWKRWSLPELPVIPPAFGIKLLKDKGVEHQFKIIKKLIHAASEVINCGDAGQEGEVIQRWVLTEAGYRKPFKRLWISSLTEEAIRQGFARLREGREFDSLYQAGKSRAIGDWLLGINATRLFTLKYAQGRQLLSLGRVQTPTLALIVQRHLEILHFKPEPFWELKTLYRDAVFSSTHGRFTEEAKGAALLAQVREAELYITDFETKKGIEGPPRLFDLTSLQVECNNRLALSADETLKTVQALYEKKIVSYPRVDTTFLPDDIYPKIPGILQGLAGYQPLTAPVLEKKIRKTARVFNNNKVTDHHAIIPTGSAATGLYGREGGVYDIIARRFIAAFYPDCIVSNTTVQAEAAGHGFRAKGKQILEPGWRVVYEKDEAKKSAPPQTSSPAGEQEGKEEETAVLPVFTKGEHGPHEPVLERKMTSPPKDFTEATLLRAMETAGKQVEDEELKEVMKENGIGRPSTRAAIIETLFKRNYLRKDKKKVLPTQMGIDLIGLIRNPTLTSPELTGQWEKKLRQIEAGNFGPEAFLEELKGLVRDMVQEVKADRSAVTLSAPVAPAPAAGEKKKRDGSSAQAQAARRPETKAPAAAGGRSACPACGSGTIIKGHQAYGCSRWKEGCNFRLAFAQYGKTLTEAQAQALLQKGKTGTIKGLVKEGSTEKVQGVLLLNDRHQVLLQETETPPAADPFARCPQCGEGRVLKGNAAYGCSRFREGCTLRIPFELAGKKLSEKQVKELLLKGKTGLIKNFVSTKTGNKFDAALQLQEEGKVNFLFGK
jgi:DNA topoisomerase III